MSQPGRPKGAAAAAGCGPREVDLNLEGDKAVLLRPATLEEMASALSAFRAEHRRWLVEELSAPRTDIDIGKLGGTATALIAGLAGTLDRPDSGGPGIDHLWSLMQIKTSGAGSRPSRDFADRFPPIPRGSRRTSVLNMPLPDQIAYLELIVGGSGERVYEALMPTLTARFACPHLEEFLSQSEDAPSFLNRVAAALGQGPGVSQGRGPTDIGACMFLAYLRREHIALLPKSCLHYRWSELRTDPHVFPSWVLDFMRAALAFAGTRPARSFTAQDLLNTARAIFLTSTASRAEDVDGELCLKFRSAYPVKPSILWATNTLASLHKTGAAKVPVNGRLELGRGTRGVPARPTELSLAKQARQLAREQATAAAPPGVITLDDPAAIRANGAPGVELVVNTTVSSVLLLDPVDRSGMERLVRDFRAEQGRWLLADLSAFRSDATASGAEGEPVACWGLSGTWGEATALRSREWRLRNIVLASSRGKAAIAFAESHRGAGSEGGVAAILGQPPEIQARFLELALGKDGARALESLTDRWATSVGCTQLEGWLREAPDVESFLAKVIARALMRGDGNSGRNEHGPAMFLSYLRKREVVLLPSSAILFRWGFATAEPLLCFEPWVLRHVEAMRDMVKEEARTDFTMRGLSKTARALWLMSTAKSPSDLTDALVAAVRPLLATEAEAGGALATIALTSREISGGARAAVGERLPARAKLIKPLSGEPSGDTAGPAPLLEGIDPSLMVVGPDSGHVRKFDREDGTQLLFNTSHDAIVLLRPMTKKKLAASLASYRKEETRRLMRIVEAPRRTVESLKATSQPDLPFGLSGAFDMVPRAGGDIKEWKLTHLLVRGPAQEEAADFLRRFEPMAGGTARTAILGMAREDQLAYLRIFTGARGENLLSVMGSQFLSNYACPELETWLERAADPAAFLAALSTSASVQSGRRDNLGGAMFLAYLRREGAILLPTRVLGMRWSPLKAGDQEVFPPWFQEHLAAVVERGALLTKAGDIVANLRRASHALYLLSNAAAPADFTEELCQAFKDINPDRSDLAWGVNKLCDFTLSILEKPVITRGSALRQAGDVRHLDRGPYDWVSTGMRSRRKAVVGYVPRADLIPWASHMDDVLSLVKVKHLETYRSTGQLFLKYLNTLTDIPAGLGDVDTCKHILDLEGKQRTFFSYLKSGGDADEAKSPGSIRNHMLRLKSGFDLLFQRHGLKARNPADVDLGSVKLPPARTQSIRSAMDPELVEAIREFNRKGDFAFSRSIQKHYRNVVDPSDKRERSAWFPAYGILIDTLLAVPFRSHDARYFDTGQGDGTVFDPKQRKMVPNPRGCLSTRQEGAIQLASGANRNRDDIWGLHVAVNKTAVGNYQGRTIPYLPADIEANLLRMTGWAESYLPIEAPVAAEDDSYLHERRADEITALVPKVWPMFRDPNRRDGQPLSRGLLYDYWCELCEAVQNSLNTGRPADKHILLVHYGSPDATEGLASGNGPSAEAADLERPVSADERAAALGETGPALESPPSATGARKVRKAGPKPAVPWAIFDIHALRVTGITSMLRAGVPPDMVREVVGHAALVMTFYYRDISMRELHVQMADYFAKRENSAEQLRGMSFDQLGNHLFNVHDPRGIAEQFGPGTGYQRLWGPSWKMFAHGICAAGDCATGGEFENGSFKPVRPTACSICRHRLTGPRFILGLIANANLLIHQMRREGERLVELQEQLNDLADASKPTFATEGEMTQARLRFEAYSIEWASEVQYVYKATDMWQQGGGPSASALTSRDPQSLIAGLEERHELHLLQSIAIASEILKWRPPEADRPIMERNEMVDRLLDRNGMPPLLMRLDGAERLLAGNALTDMFLRCVPERALDGLLSGASLLDNVMDPELRELFVGAVGEISKRANLPLLHAAPPREDGPGQVH